MKRQIVALIALVFLLLPMFVGIARIRKLPRKGADEEGEDS